MKKLVAWFLFGCAPVFAADLTFSDAIPVTTPRAGVFHHLDASGRKNIALTDSHVAVVWEDNRSGKPQIYTAFKAFNSSHFSPALALTSDKQEAYEPTLLAIDNTTFIYGWEQDQHVWLNTVSDNKAGSALQLDQHRSSQISLARTRNGKIYAAWIQQSGQQQQLVVSEITLARQQLHAQAAVIVDAHTAQRRQGYPSLVAVKNTLVLGWEDRQHGHTRIYTSYSDDQKTFAKKQLLNDFVPPPNPEFGRGTGATRVALASDNNSMVAAVWMDKRDFLGGYDVYAAISSDDGENFGPDEKAQDMLGENQPQWHPAIAMTAHSHTLKNKLIVAWDDPRDDSPDVWYSQRSADGWSDDETLAAASGSGAQANPSIAFDAQGNLHLVWIAQTASGSELRYSHSR